jgi:hypothetical protein
LAVFAPDNSESGAGQNYEPTDEDSRVARMKDGRTHFAYKAEYAGDVEGGLIVAPVVHRADDANRNRGGGSEKVERSFAHICQTGGGRRTRLRGIVNVSKSHLIRAAAWDIGSPVRHRNTEEPARDRRRGAACSDVAGRAASVATRCRVGVCHGAPPVSIAYTATCDSVAKGGFLKRAAKVPFVDSATC